MKPFFFTLGILLLMSGFELCAQALVINEFMSKNQTVLTDFEGDTPDWIELYNPNSESLSLTGFKLSDNADFTENNWTFPLDISIPPYGFLLVFASGKDGVFDDEIHTNFSISSEGEMLSFLNADGNVLDQVEPVSLNADLSYGRTLDGSNDWSFFSQTSPNGSNENNLGLYTLEFSHSPGIYTDSFDLTIAGSIPLDIHYTLNGELPLETSSLYEESIYLDALVDAPNINSLVRSTVQPYEPVGNTDKINIVRAAGFLNGQRVTPVYTHTYMIEPNEDRYQLPILSLVTDPEYLFGDTLGIHILGYLFDSLGIANYNGKGKEWERPIHLSFFMEDGTLDWEQNCGIRMHGNGPRYERQKSFRLYGRKEYGKEFLDYPILTDRPFDKYERMILRTTQSSYNDTYFADEMASACVANQDVIHRQAYRLTILFLNGEYWGVYSFKERQDEEYIKNHFDLDKDSLDMLQVNQNILFGNDEHYQTLLDFLEENDPSVSDNYEYVKTQMDVDQYIEYLVFQFYFANIDWPYNNIVYFRPQSETGKWKWLLQDIDFGLKIHWRQSITHFMNNQASENPPWATYLGRRLMENQEFVDQFISRSEFHLNNSLSNDSLKVIADGLIADFLPHVAQQTDRFNYQDDLFENPYEEWLENLNSLYYFISERPCRIQSEIESNFGVLIGIEDCDFSPFDLETFIANQEAEEEEEEEEEEIETPVDSTLLGTNVTMHYTIEQIGNQLQISCPNCKESNWSILLSDIQGRVVFEKAIQFEHTNYQVPLPQLPMGIYLVCIRNENATNCRRIFIV